MKKLLLGLIAFFVFTGMALAAVNLNTATRDELETVEGIGPKKAEAILNHRNKHGLFKSVDDLKNVNGFGEKTVAEMRSKLTVGANPAVMKKDKPAKAEAKPEAAKADKK